MNRPDGARYARALRFLAIVFLGMQLLFLLGVVAGEAVPDRRVADALVDAVDSGQLTENHYETSGLGNRLDQFTECVALTMGLGDPADSFQAETALTSPTLWKCEVSVPLLRRYAETGGLDEGDQYFRYWHGYTVITRPLLATVGVDGLRYMTFGLLLAAATSLFVVIGRAAGWISPALLLAPLLLTSDFADLPLHIPHGISMTAALAGGAAIWWTVERTRSLTRTGAVAMALGGLFVYVDLSTNPPLALLAVIGLAMTAAFSSGRSHADAARVGGVSLVAWLAGFGGTWITKWLLAALLLGFDKVWEDITNQVRFRVEGDHELVDEAFGAAVRDNFDYWTDRPLMSTGLALLLVLIVALSAARAWRVGGRPRLAWLALLGFPALLPVIWYELAGNHSQIHEFFTYRSLPFALGYVLLVTYVVCWRAAPASDREKISS